MRKWFHIGCDLSSVNAANATQKCIEIALYLPTFLFNSNPCHSVMTEKSNVEATFETSISKVGPRCVIFAYCPGLLKPIENCPGSEAGMDRRSEKSTEDDQLRR